ncbi:MAG: hypothetical protein WD048_01260 [Chitinophagales bacterium]
MKYCFLNLKVGLLFLFTLLLSPELFSQINRGNVGIGTLTPDSSAILDLESTEKGFLQPRMSTAERDLINDPATGLAIFNVDDSTHQYYNGTCWINVFQRNCDDCFFTITPSSIADTIDRTQTDSITITLDIVQNTGAAQNIALNIVNVLPQGMSANFSQNPVFSTGSSDLTIKVTPFTPDGSHAIIIQALCGSSIYNIVYSLYLEPCYYLDVNNNQSNYIMSVDLYTTYPQLLLSPNDPVCVVNEVLAGVSLEGTSIPAIPFVPPVPPIPAYSMGPIPTGSRVAIVNNGQIIGAGGDGGTATDPNFGYTGEGFDGGDAIRISANTSVLNNGYIFGGGGGGGAVAFQIGIPLGPIFFGFLIGSGGGGGAGGGDGGNIPTLVGIQFYSQGLDGSDGIFGTPGQGGILQLPINIQQGPVSITINPNVRGGNGGAYGFPGTAGLFQVSLSASIVVNIPFIGPITIPIVTNLNIPIPLPIPAAGDGGYAVKRNGNPLNLTDQVYNTTFLKGRVGN